MQIEVQNSITIPEGVNIKVEGRVVTINGEKGELTRDFSHAPVAINMLGKTIQIKTNWPRKREAALVGTISSHIQNMIKGVTKGFTYTMKIVFSHFPISVKVTERTIVIENFTGERRARSARIIGNTKVKVKDEDIIIQGINLEEVSQTAANIQNATKVKHKDPRVFLDGIFVYEQSEGMED